MYVAGAKIRDIRKATRASVKTIMAMARKHGVSRRKPRGGFRPLKASELATIKRMIAQDATGTEICAALRAPRLWLRDVMRRHGLRLTKASRSRSAMQANARKAGAWSPEDRAVYRALYEAGAHFEQMMAYFGRSYESIRNTRIRLKLSARIQPQKNTPELDGVPLIAAVARLRFRGHMVRPFGGDMWIVDGDTLTERQVLGRVQWLDQHRRAA